MAAYVARATTDTQTTAPAAKAGIRKSDENLLSLSDRISPDFSKNVLNWRELAVVAFLRPPFHLRICPDFSEIVLLKGQKPFSPHFHRFTNHQTTAPPTPSVTHLLPTSVPRPGTEPATHRPMHPATNHCATQADDQCAFFCSYILRRLPPKLSRTLRICPLLTASRSEWIQQRLPRTESV